MLNVVIQAASAERQDHLATLIDSTGYAITVLGLSRLPSEGVSELEQRLQKLRPDVIIIDIPPERTGPAVGIIELLHLELPQLAIFAVGDTNNGETLVSAMRAGACEFIEAPASKESLARSLGRLGMSPAGSHDARIITVLDSKGGCGATTVAVNVATALAANGRRTVLLDLAPIGVTALHFNVEPKYTIRELLDSLERLDDTLLQSFITETKFGVDLLGGTDSPIAMEFSAHEIYGFLQRLSTRYDYVVIDLSWRLDGVVRAACALSTTVLLTCEADVVSLLWNAGRVQKFIAAAPGSDKVRLVLNRWHSGGPYTDADAEAAAEAKLIAKIPSDARRIALAVDTGTPVVIHQKNSEVARCFWELAAALDNQGCQESVSLPKPDHRAPISLFGGNTGPGPAPAFLARSVTS